MRLLSLFGAAIAVSALSLPALAAPITGQISLGGYVEAIGSSGIGSATGLDFVQGASGSASPGVPGGITSFGAGTGSFAGLACANVGGTCGSIKDIFSFTTSPPISSFLTLTSGATTISFDLNIITGITRGSDATGGSLTLTANGLLHFTGLDNTAGTFTLTAQGNQITSFSATTLSIPFTAAATPEPSSLALLATGIGSVVGLVRRRRS